MYLLLKHSKLHKDMTCCWCGQKHLEKCEVCIMNESNRDVTENHFSLCKKCYDTDINPNRKQFTSILKGSRGALKFGTGENFPIPPWRDMPVCD